MEKQHVKLSKAGVSFYSVKMLNVFFMPSISWSIWLFFFNID